MKTKGLANLWPVPQCSGQCPGMAMALASPPELRRRKGSIASLVALLIPGTLFGLGLALLRQRPEFSWINQAHNFPWQLWVIAFSGGIATLAGLGDWAFHRWVAKCVIGKKERDCELLALAGGGVPMFVLMSLASISRQPLNYLLPVLVVLLFTATLICYDEFIFHRRRCRKMESLLHRGLVFGNAAAWFAWAHWCFVKGGAYA